MKKKLVCFLVLLCAAFTFAGCADREPAIIGGGSPETENDGNQNNNNGPAIGYITELSSTMFSNCSIDMDDVGGLGIAETGGKNFFVYLDENGRLKDVVFLRGSGSGAQEITQEHVTAGQIDKLYVTEKFTFIMYTSLPINPESQQYENYHTWGYQCNSYAQSFAIDHHTGKIYSLANVIGSSHANISSDYITVGYPEKYYALEIKNNNLVATDLVPAVSLTVHKIITDKYDNMYIGYTGVADREGRFFYYSFPTDLSGTEYSKGSDGAAYKVTHDFYNYYEIKKMNSNFGESSIGTSANVSLERGFSYYDIIIKGNVLYDRSYDSIRIFRYDNGKFVYGYSDNYLTIPNAKFDSVVVYDAEIYYIGNDNKLYRYDLQTRAAALVLNAASGLKIEGAGLYAYAQGATSVKKYKITFASGTAAATLVSTEIYDRNAITIQPLN